LTGPGEDQTVSASAWQRYSPRPLTDGERWTAEALAQLRRRRYRPRAWAAFIRSALERSAEARGERPATARQAQAWCLGGAAAWLAACTAARGREELVFRPATGLAWWLAVWQMLDWHLGMAEGGDGRPRPRLGSADAITLARFWLVPAARATARSPAGFPLLIAAGGISDWLDGAVARRDGRTRLGRDLDTTADLAFLTAVAFAGRSAGRIPEPAFRLLVVRHAVGVGISLTAVFGRARRPAFRARPWGGALRFGGLVTCACGAEGAGTWLLGAGSVMPPRSTAPDLSPA